MKENKRSYLRNEQRKKSKAVLVTAPFAMKQKIRVLSFRMATMRCSCGYFIVVFLTCDFPFFLSRLRICKKKRDDVKIKNFLYVADLTVTDYVIKSGA